MKKLFLVVTLLLVMSFASYNPAYAAVTTFFGQDLGLGEGTPLSSWANSTAARNSFFGNLTGGVGTENFEGFANGTGVPLNVNFGASGTATLNGGTSVANVTPGTTNGVGRYATSGSKYWETSSSLFSLSFNTPQSAFGFFGIDAGDFNGQLTLTYGSNTLTIPHTVGAPGGSIIYFGFYDTTNSFSNISFSNTGSNADYFGFDDFSIGTREQINPTVPEPATMSLLGMGLLGLLGFRKKKIS